MKQSEFLEYLSSNSKHKRQLKQAANESDGVFYFMLGEIFGILGINGWQSEAFICKVCKICDIEF